MGCIARAGRLNTPARAVALILALAFAGTAQAAGCRPPASVRFAPGARTAELTGGIPRGDRDCFTIAARRGQRLSVSQGDGESNVVMQIYAPPWQVRKTADGPAITGHPLPGAAEGNDAAHWAGVLGRAGTYLLVLGTSWGGGAYRVRIALR